MSEATPWHAIEERGATLGMRIVVWLYRGVGRAAAKLLLRPIVAYFFLAAAGARRASRVYLERVYATEAGARALGRAPTTRLVYAHFLEFGWNLLDRVGFWLADPRDFEIVVRGREHLESAHRGGRGALVLGSHLGSFDVMRLFAAFESPLRVHVLMYTAHAHRINRVLSLDEHGRAGAALRVVPIVPGSQGHVWESRACVRRGEVVAVLADRLAPVPAPSALPVRFLGATAWLPEGPFRLGSLLGCPILTMTALRVGERRYEVVVEPLADRPERGRDRDAAQQDLAQRYADRLEALCLRAPLQWFNFFDFWRSLDAG